ncbi:MAG TPA: hypothetical protein ENN43_04535 [bacterium]|nr:hypothetical protein [bacterium]
MNNAKSFILKTVTVTLCALAVIAAAKIFIVDELKKPVEHLFISGEAGETAGSGAAAARPWRDKKKIKINWRDAGKHIGEYAEIEGVIAASKNTGKVCFLNMDKDFRRHLTLVIFASDFKKFPENPEKYYLGKKVRAEGRLKEYNGKPEIILNSLDQIEVVK